MKYHSLCFCEACAEGVEVFLLALLTKRHGHHGYHRVIAHRRLDLVVVVALHASVVPRAELATNVKVKQIIFKELQIGIAGHAMRLLDREITPDPKLLATKVEQFYF